MIVVIIIIINIRKCMQQLLLLVFRRKVKMYRMIGINACNFNWNKTVCTFLTELPFSKHQRDKQAVDKRNKWLGLAQ